MKNSKKKSKPLKNCRNLIKIKSSKKILLRIVIIFSTPFRKETKKLYN